MFSNISGIYALGLCNEIEDEDKKWRFMGVHSRNREEWAIVAIACLRSSVTVVPFYDSLGHDALTYVINHPPLMETMCIEKKNLA